MIVAPGEQIGKYRLVAKLGEGGMGMVFKAEHTLIKRRAAIKVLQPDLARRADLVDRFFREALATAAIHHPGIVDIYDFGYHNGETPYLVMEYLEGESLRTRLKRERTLGVTTIVELARQIARAVSAVHELSIIHRDLKPDNLFLTPDPDIGGGQRVKVLDFGIAKLKGALTGGGPETKVGVAMGTVGYMAPEQCRGEQDIDHRCDIYSLGCIMFELLTGRPPYVSSDPVTVMVAHMEAAVPKPSDYGRTTALDAMVVRMLAKHPAHRFASMKDVVEEIDLCAVQGGSGPRDSARVFGSGPRESEREIGEASTIAMPAATASPTTVAFGIASSAPTKPRAPAPATPSASRGRSRALFVLFPVLVAVAIGIVIMKRPKREAHVAATPADAIAIDAAIDAPIDAPVDAPIDTLDASAPPDAAEIELQITSTPSGATVLDDRGATLGRTPLTLTRVAGAGKLQITLRRTGYHPSTIELPLDRNGVGSAVLRPRSKSTGSGFDLDDEPIR